MPEKTDKNATFPIGSAEVLRYAAIRGHNRRILIMFVRDKTSGAVGVNLETKRLLGDWRERNITGTQAGFTIETFEAMFEGMNLLRTDPYYKNLTRVQTNYIEKNRFTCATNCKTIHNNEPDA